MDRKRKYEEEQKGRLKVHPANRSSSRYKCLNCSKIFEADPKLIYNETVGQYCFCGYMNIFTFDSSFNMIQRIGCKMEYPEYHRLSNLEETRK